MEAVMKCVLTIELIPSTSFYKNLRSILPKEQWDYLRKGVYKNANYKCEICGGVGEQWPVECHEVWQFDDNAHIQKLIGLVALCPLCHKVKHIGLAQINGELHIAKKHFMKVNNISMLEADRIIETAFEIWRRRSLSNWEIDLSWIERNGTEEIPF